MTVHKCDICGKEMGVWLDIKMTIGGSYPETNVADFLNLQGHTELCKECCIKYITKKGESE